VFFFFLSGCYGFYSLILKDLPHPKDLLNRHSPLTTKIYSNSGQLLYKIYQQENRSIVSLSEIPNHVIQATLAIEDAEFYQHPGFSTKGIVRAVQNNLTRRSLQGGSTITQQLIKNTLLSPEKSYIRKTKEIILALLVESYFTKDEILAMYFNQVGYGGTAYGIEAAAQMYFNKSVRDLNLAEAALIAGLPAAPTSYSPYGSRPETAVTRQHEVLRRMVEEGYISYTLAEQAKAQPLNYSSPATDITAPHFVMYVKDQLVDRYGEQLVNQGGLKVVTTIDLTIQTLVEDIVRTQLPLLTPLNIHNAAVIVTRPKTGEVLAMVGSVDYFDSENDGQVNVVLRPRQPGSSIKPINYAMALENGLTPASLIVDAPVTYQIKGSPPYTPRNYDNRYHGIVSLRTALANSYNIPAVKILDQFGISRMVTIGQALGISTWNNPSRFGLALTLGGGEVTLADMAVAYGTFANSGIRTNLHPIASVTDFTATHQDRFDCPLTPSQIALAQPAHAQDSQSRCPQETQVIKPSTAFLISSILSDNDARTPMFGRHSILSIPPHQVAVKTGTTNNLRDNWTIGYTTDYLVGVWVGNNDNTPMSQVASGITGASPLFSQIMSALIQDETAHIFTLPSGIIQTTICPLTGTLTCQACPNPRPEYFAAGTEPKRTCNEPLVKQLLETQNKDPQPRPH
jgi:1A family penicillin-binding protein